MATGQTSTGAVAPGVGAVTRADVEDFLYHEADLLDSWKLEAWLELLTDDIVYEVPPTDAPDADSANTLFLVSDNAMRVRSRVEQLLSGQAWSETPRSRTRRFVSNVRIGARRGNEIDVMANFCIHRFRSGASDVYVGRYDHVLVLTDKGPRIRRRRATLDLESLRPHGKVSIIL
jgi:p-cumate 2,3-dioxygenase beta subunit